MILDSWTIDDADKVWDFHIEIHYDDETGRPDKHADAYDPEFLEKQGEIEASRWARETLKAWRNDLWNWAVIHVTPLLKGKGVSFEGDSQVLCSVDYGWIPGPGSGVWTSDRSYLRTALLNDMMEEAKSQAENKLSEIKEESE